MNELLKWYQGKGGQKYTDKLFKEKHRAVKKLNKCLEKVFKECR